MTRKFRYGILVACCLFLGGPALAGRSAPGVLIGASSASGSPAAVAMPALARPAEPAALGAAEANLADNLIQAERNTDEKVANLIQILIWCVLGLTLAVAIGVFWTLTLLQSFLKQWALKSLKESFREIQAMATDANAQFVSALEMFLSHQLLAKREKLQEQMQGLSLPNLEAILQAVVELAVQPARLQDQILAIAYRLEPFERQIQRVYSLWAEVKSEAIDLRTAQKLVLALIPLVEEKADSARVARVLKKFEKQLAGAILGALPLPSEPGF